MRAIKPIVVVGATEQSRPSQFTSQRRRVEPYPCLSESILISSVAKLPRVRCLTTTHCQQTVESLIILLFTKYYLSLQFTQMLRVHLTLKLQYLDRILVERIKVCTRNKLFELYYGHESYHNMVLTIF